MAPKKQSKKSSAKSTKKKMKSAMPMMAAKAIPAKQTRSQVLQIIAQQNELTIKQVKAVFSTANQLLHGHMVKRGSGEFVLPEIAIKVMRKTKAATKARPGRNPLTGESITIAAKPKKEVIRVRVLKALKEVLAQA